MGWAWSTIILVGPDRITPAISHSDNQAAEFFFLPFHFLVAGHLKGQFRCPLPIENGYAWEKLNVPSNWHCKNVWCVTVAAISAHKFLQKKNCVSFQEKMKKGEKIALNSSPGCA
jgi:hypothetical protein